MNEQSPPSASAGSEANLVQQYLHDRDVPCPVCKYNLRRAPGRNCPECGARLDLRIGSIDLKLTPWMFGTLALAIPLGFNSVLAVIASIGAKISAYWQTQDWYVLGGAWTCTAIFAALLWAHCRRRPRFLQRRPRTQWLIAAILALIVISIEIAAVVLMNRLLTVWW